MPANLHHRNSLPALLPSFGSLVSPQSTWRLPALSHSHSFHPYQRPLVHTDSSPGCRHPAEYPGGNAIPCATATVDAQSPHPIITAFDHQKVTGSQSNFYGCSLTTPNKGNPNGLNNLHQGVSKVSCFIAPNSQPPHVSRMPQQHPPHFKPIPSKLTVPSQPPQKLRNNHSPTAPFTFSGHLYSAHPHTAHPTFSSHHHIAIWSQPSPQRAFQQLRHQRSTVLTAVSPHSVARPPPTPHAASATISPDSTPRPYTCAICFKTFGRSNDLKRHALTHTPDEKPYSCRWCSKKFSRPDSVRKHELSVVEGRRVRCTAAGAAGGSGSAEDGEDE
ncbi:hypothetical protein BC830DRAFT_1095482 [Chytriomyces sp. MP71]|nr:hypothetical protein BC830DRAFT_1095456 [Chytriomyces sp. MP71]KAI8621154.1 hypothetical protein BC830DRAFT_1095482 [Chytriomyces sp. MP71]